MQDSQLDPFERFVELQALTFEASAACGRDVRFRERVEAMLRPDSGRAEAALRLLLWRPPPSAVDFLEGVFLNAVDGTPGLGVPMALSLLRGLPREQVDEGLYAVLPVLLAQLDADQVVSVATILIEFGMVRHFPAVAGWLEENGGEENLPFVERLRNGPSSDETPTA